MNIAMLGHKRIPSREGGVEIVVEELSTRMVRLGHQVTCFNRNGHHVSGKEFDVERLQEYQGVKLRNVFTVNKKGLAAMSSSFFGAICAAFGQYDVVHFHAEGPAFMCWLPKLMKKKVIVTVHGLDHQRDKWGRFARAYIMAGEKCAVRYADQIIVLSRNVQDYFEQIYHRQTAFIPNGVCRFEIVPAQEITKRWGLKKNGYVLFLGRLVPEKGIHYLIEAWKGIRTELKLVIAGGSSDTEIYKGKLQQMADESMIFTGFVQGHVLEELYSNAYVYVLPSDLEGMPLSLLEAMSYSNCCLISDIPECTEVVTDHAVTFQKANVDDLREKLQYLLDNRIVVEEYKKSAVDYVLSKYNWHDVVCKTIELYQKSATG